MKLIITVLLILNYLPGSYAQNDSTENSRLDIFKNKLNNYFEKHEGYNDYPMTKKIPDTGKYNMPTGKIKSYMIDEQTGLAFEFTTKKIFDKETGMIYHSKKNQIHDTIKGKLYNYSVPKNNYDKEPY